MAVLENFLKLFFFILLLQLFSCNQETNESLPIYVSTNPVIVKNDSIFQYANITYNDLSKVQRYGFFVDENEIPDINSEVIFAKDYNKDMVYSSSRRDIYIKDRIYYSRSFVEINNVIHYGNIVSFKSSNQSKLIGNLFTPKEGRLGEYVKLFGENFDKDTTDIQILFGSEIAEKISLTANSILVKVPYYSEPGYCNITIKRKKTSYTYPETFLLYGPLIESFTPNSTSDSTIITIRGKNFSPNSYRNNVYIGSQKLDVLSSTSEEIIAKANVLFSLPDTLPIIVAVNEIATKSKKKFQIFSKWKKMGNIPMAITNNSVFVVGNKIYICTGTTNPLIDTAFKKVLYEFDTETKRWTRKADFPGNARIETSAFSINGKGYVFGGFSGKPHYETDMWEYDPDLNSWTKKANCPTYIRGYCAVSTDTLGYTYDGNDIYTYNPSLNQWQLASTYHNDIGGLYLWNTPYYFHDNKISLYGGIDNNISDERCATAVYDINENKWIPGKTYIEYPSITFFNEQELYVIAGEKQILYKYDFATNQYTAINKFPDTNRVFMDRGVIVNNKLYCGGGETFCDTYDSGCNGGVLTVSDFWCFDLLNQ